MSINGNNDKFLEAWIWDAACSIRGAKGDSKNYITETGIERIAHTFIQWQEEDKFSRIVDKEEIVKNDYNISPSRYIHTDESETYRPITEIMEELEVLEEEVIFTKRTLKKILNPIGILGVK